MVVSFGIQASTGAEIEVKPPQVIVSYYADLWGLPMYYASEGFGRPLVLNHEGVACKIDHCFGKIRRSVKKKREEKHKT